MANISGTISKDMLKGARAYVQVAPWVTAGGAGTLIAMGFVDDVSFEASTEIKKISAGNCFLPIDGYVSARDFGLKFTVKEARLRHFAQALNDDPINGGTGDVVVRPTANFDAKLGLDEQQGMRYWQVVCTISDQLMMPSYTTEDASDPTYTKRTITLWRCLLETKTSAKLVRDGEWSVPVTVHPLVDSSVTYSKGVVGRVGKIVDSVS